MSGVDKIKARAAEVAEKLEAYGEPLDMEAAGVINALVTCLDNAMDARDRAIEDLANMCRI